MIIPGLGALINGSINLAFQRMNHTNAKDYFRKLYLDNRYGKEVVEIAIEREIQVLKTKAM
jgi:hypothetical protein